MSDHEKQRLGMYRKIEIGRKQLPTMDEDEVFRDFLASRFYGKRSRKDLSFTELKRLVDLLARMGAVYTSKPGNKRRERNYVRADWVEIPDDDVNAATKRAICAIWRKLGYAMTSLETRIERETGIVSILCLHDEKRLAAILTDLQAREAAAVRRAAAVAVAESTRRTDSDSDSPKGNKGYHVLSYSVAPGTATTA
jgi:hypothetical protein